MAKKVYLGVNSYAQKVRKIYVGVDGVARRIKKAYIGIGGVARPCWNGVGISYYGITGPLNYGSDYCVCTTAGEHLIVANSDTENKTYPESTVNAYDSNLTRCYLDSLSSPRTGFAAASANSVAIFTGGKCTGDTYDWTDAYDGLLTKFGSVCDNNGADSVGLAGASAGYRAFFAGGSFTDGSGLRTDACAIDNRLVMTILECNYPHGYTFAASSSGHAIFRGNQSEPPEAFDVNCTLTSGINYSWNGDNTATASTNEYAMFAGGTRGTEINHYLDAYNDDLSLQYNYLNDMTGVITANAGGGSPVYGVFVNDNIAICVNLQLGQEVVQLPQYRFPACVGGVGAFVLLVGGDVGTSHGTNTVDALEIFD